MTTDVQEGDNKKKNNLLNLGELFSAFPNVYKQNIPLVFMFHRCPSRLKTDRCCF